MKFKNIAVLTSRESWFVEYARELVELFKKRNLNSRLFFNPDKISERYEIVFILSYFRVLKKNFLEKHIHNLVVHESNLPKGKGWSPLFWQILEGKNRIPIVLFEATEKVDEGKIFLKDYIVYEGHELHDEIREKQARKTIELCLKFVEEYSKLRPKRQCGKSTYYRRRTPQDSKLDVKKTLRKQFNLLRIVDNENFPAFFYYKGHKYILKIYKERDDLNAE